ncbi:siroheme synthase CysG [Labrys monachus]|uniref:Uroporphyrin-III C-methyltransferase/precorrin-2 dehydrogenase/sirohydrochlorin ferrochelatase n=1 Tax=Labrys monachus TaxID=217067 RepID=A0ABU0FF53_9HYPH|nr:siroheme synthase CysG [Labrys monachus]MDQ0393237.1 uroporphyrin-III C-methyltransferase/precorrin-2 dehydrogenase/sirohydrochlorin ferrochelatase [Labrys monachus]
MTPSLHEPERIAPLAVLPVFYRLGGKDALVIGATQAAAWKAELLAAAGARVTVIAPPASDPPPSAAVAPEPAVRTLARRWEKQDLLGMALVVADVDDDAEAARLAAAAREAGVPANIIDRPAFCDFQFGSIVNRSPLVVGISTDGAAPVFGQAIRARIEMLLPDGFRRWAEAAREWRPLVQSLGLPLQGRRRIWERFVDAAFRSPDHAPSEAQRQALLASAANAGSASGRGRVSLVGAGPGDPELLTLKAVRTLQSADVILYDSLVSAEVLDFARREAERIIVGKRGHRPSCKQGDINALMVSLAAAGKHVVRLKGGDPLVFGRAGEEIAACREAGVDVEVIPGITAASGAAASLEVSLTHRDHARRLQYITAHAKNGKLPDDLDWTALADPAATTAIYMGKLVVAEVSSRLVAAGMNPATPAVVVENATLKRERRFHSTVGAMASVFAEHALDGPCIILLGWAMSEARRGDVGAPADPAGTHGGD